MHRSTSSLHSLPKSSRLWDADKLHQCPNCKKTFETAHALRTHSKMKAECRRSMKAPDLGAIDAIAEDGEDGDSDSGLGSPKRKKLKMRKVVPRENAKWEDVKAKGKGRAKLKSKRKDSSDEGKERVKGRRKRLRDSLESQGQELGSDISSKEQEQEVTQEMGDDGSDYADIEMQGLEDEVEMDPRDVEDIFMDMGDQYQHYMPARPLSEPGSHTDTDSDSDDAMDVDIDPSGIASTSSHPIHPVPLSAHRTTSVRLDDEEDDRVVDISERGGESFGSGINSHDHWQLRLKELAKEMQDREHVRLERERRRREERGLDEDETIESDDWENNEWIPFRSKLDWDIAKWAIDEGIGKGSIDRLLQIPGVSILPKVFNVRSPLITI